MPISRCIATITVLVCFVALSCFANETATTTNTAQSNIINDAAAQVFLEVCTKDMIEGLEAGLTKNMNQQQADDVLQNPDTKAEVTTLANDICSCAAPKYSHVLKQSLHKPDNQETKLFFEQKAYELIMHCAAESKSNLLKN